MLDDARHPPDVLEEGSRRNAWITAVERRYESLEQARKPAVIRRLLELRRVVEPLDRARALETQLAAGPVDRSEEHTSELQSQSNLVCRLLLEKKKKNEGSQVR